MKEMRGASVLWGRGTLHLQKSARASPCSRACTVEYQRVSSVPVKIKKTKTQSNCEKLDNQCRMTLEQIRAKDTTTGVLIPLIINNLNECKVGILRLISVFSDLVHIYYCTSEKKIFLCNFIPGGWHVEGLQTVFKTFMLGNKENIII